MKLFSKVRLSGLLLPSLLPVFLILCFVGCKDDKPVTSCVWGENVPEEELDPILKTSHDIMNLIEQQKYSEVYDLSCKWVKSHQTRDQFIGVLKMSDNLLGAKQFSRITEVYFLNSEAKTSEVMVPCNLGAQGIDDIWSVPANDKVAGAVFNSTPGSQMVRVIIQMIWEDEQYRPMSVSVNPMTLKNRTAEYYIKQARENREANKLHLAMLQYQVAALLNDLGPNIQEWTISAIGSEMSQIPVDYMPTRSVQVWTTSTDNTYNVFNIGVVGAGDKLFIDLTYITQSLEDEPTINRESYDLARMLVTKFPEYKEGFDGIRTTAITSKEQDIYKSFHVIIPFEDLLSKKKTPEPKTP